MSEFSLGEKLTIEGVPYRITSKSSNTDLSSTMYTLLELDGLRVRKYHHDELVKALNPESDMVNHPAHYTGHPTIEAIEVLEHVQDYRLGTAMKYLWRIAFGGKHDSVEDAKKAVWYINRWLEKQSDV